LAVSIQNRNHNYLGLSLLANYDHFLTIDCLPGHRGTQGCCAEVSGVSPNIDSTSFFCVLLKIVPQKVNFSQIKVSQNFFIPKRLKKTALTPWRPFGESKKGLPRPKQLKAKFASSLKKAGCIKMKKAKKLTTFLFQKSQMATLESKRMPIWTFYSYQNKIML